MPVYPTPPRKREEELMRVKAWSERENTMKREADHLRKESEKEKNGASRPPESRPLPKM